MKKLFLYFSALIVLSGCMLDVQIYEPKDQNSLNTFSLATTPFSRMYTEESLLQVEGSAGGLVCDSVLKTENNATVYATHTSILLGLRTKKGYYVP
ncbi:hypothetical protein BDW_08435 [Bdellovibrio bacteriovorus W]|nr:hypothetical protein BDW_08435 [Bdellovibrio bacteriovorus W]